MVIVCFEYLLFIDYRVYLKVIGSFRKLEDLGYIFSEFFICWVILSLEVDLL